MSNRSTRNNKKKGTTNKKRGGGNCGSSGCKKSQDNPWHQIDRESSRKTVYNIPQNMVEKEDSWDELIKALEDENENEQKKENQKEKVIVNQHVDWTAVIKAAEVANQNEKKLQELAANQQISNYKQRTQTRADQAIQRMFHRKTSKNRRRKTP
jgi:hypothetical protein